jgi:hypothetical protein
MTSSEAACLIAGLIVGASLTVLGLWSVGAFDNWTYNRRINTQRKS